MNFNSSLRGCNVAWEMRKMKEDLSQMQAEVLVGLGRKEKEGVDCEGINSIRTGRRAQVSSW